MTEIIKGDIIFTPAPEEFRVLNQGYLVIKDGLVDNVYETLPEELKGHEVKDYGKKLIIPGFVDVHLHAPQYNNKGLGMDEELLQWLEKYTFPEEAKYKDMSYAKASYKKLVKDLVRCGTTSSVIFGSIYKETTLELMRMLDDAGLRAYVGKVNMDRNSPDFYVEDSHDSLSETENFIKKSAGFKTVKPVVTPRFVPSCTAELMKSLGSLAEEKDLPVQSHLSENLGEIAWVKELHPECESYLEVYHKYGLIRNNYKTVMAHCVWNDEKDMDFMKQYEITVAHCPHSNANLASGIAPISTYMDKGINVGMGSDISGGHELFIPSSITLASQLSKMRFRHVDEKSRIITIPELFYIATKGGGKLFGKVGSFEKDYHADYLVVNDENLADMNERSIEERLMRFLYLGTPENIEKRFVNGKELEYEA